MKRKFIAGVLLSTMLFSLTACGSRKNEKEIKENTQSGKSVETTGGKNEEKFQAVDGKVEVYLPVHYTFSQTQESYGKEIIVQDEGNMEYDQNGLLMKEEIHEESNIDGFTESDYTNTYRYNTKYQLVHVNDESEYASYYDGGTVEYSYDYEDGNLSSIERVGRTGEETVYSFDQESGVLIQSVAYDTSLSGTVTRTYTYQYDKDANITRYDTNYDSTKNGSEYEGYYFYEYDEKGNVVKRVHVDYEGDQSEASVVYDAEGYITSCDEIKFNGIQIEYNELHKPVSISYSDRKLRYEYDNNLISKIYSESDEDTAVLNLQYDENGNLTDITDEKDTNYKVTIEYEKYYVDQEYFEYYFNCYYNGYQTIPLDNIFRFCITEINNDVLQGDILSEFCNLPYISIEDGYTGNVLKADAIPAEYVSMPEWKKAYIDYFIQDENCDFETYKLGDLNKDGVPEICIDYETSVGTGLIYINNNNEVIKITNSGHCAYSSKCISIGNMRWGQGWDSVYCYDESTGDYLLAFDGSYNSDTMSDYKINGISCTEEEYKEEYLKVTDGVEWWDIGEFLDKDTLTQAILRYE